MYRFSSKNILANTLSCHKQNISRQKALKKAYCTQVLFTPDKLDLKITRKLFTKLASVLKTFINFLKAFVVLTNSYIPLNLINHILTTNKQSPSLKDKRAKAIKIIKTKKYKTLVYYTKAS
jgi:hypothetical protein